MNTIYFATCATTDSNRFLDSCGTWRRRSMQIKWKSTIRWTPLIVSLQSVQTTTTKRSRHCCCHHRDHNSGYLRCHRIQCYISPHTITFNTILTSIICYIIIHSEQPQRRRRYWRRRIPVRAKTTWNCCPKMLLIKWLTRSEMISTVIRMRSANSKQQILTKCSNICNKHLLVCCACAGHTKWIEK